MWNACDVELSEKDVYNYLPFCESFNIVNFPSKQRDNKLIFQ